MGRLHGTLRCAGLGQCQHLGGVHAEHAAEPKQGLQFGAGLVAFKLRDDGGRDTRTCRHILDRQPVPFAQVAQEGEIINRWLQLFMHAIFLTQ